MLAERNKAAFKARMAVRTRLTETRIQGQQAESAINSAVNPPDIVVNAPVPAEEDERVSPNACCDQCQGCQKWNKLEAMLCNPAVRVCLTLTCYAKFGLVGITWMSLLFTSLELPNPFYGRTWVLQRVRSLPLVRANFCHNIVRTLLRKANWITSDGESNVPAVTLSTDGVVVYPNSVDRRDDDGEMATVGEKFVDETTQVFVRSFWPVIMSYPGCSSPMTLWAQGRAAQSDPDIKSLLHDMVNASTSLERMGLRVCALAADGEYVLWVSYKATPKWTELYTAAGLKDGGIIDCVFSEFASHILTADGAPLVMDYLHVIKSLRTRIVNKLEKGGVCLLPGVTVTSKDVSTFFGIKRDLRSTVRYAHDHTQSDKVALQLFDGCDFLAAVGSSAKSAPKIALMLSIGTLLTLGLCLETPPGLVSAADRVTYVYAAMAIAHALTAPMNAQAGLIYMSMQGGHSRADAILTILAGMIQAARRGAEQTFSLTTAASEHHFANLRANTGTGAHVDLVQAHRFTAVLQAACEADAACHMFSYGSNAHKGGMSESVSLVGMAQLTEDEIAEAMSEGFDLATALIHATGRWRGIPAVEAIDARARDNGGVWDRTIAALQSGKRHTVLPPRTNGAGRHTGIVASKQHQFIAVTE